LYGIYLGYEMTYSFLGAVSLVVAAIPEMLPALVTAILAVSGTIMASRKALIRHLPAAETLGAVSVICSDKTGTLTENRMTVTRVYAGGEVFSVSGVGYDIAGEFSTDNKIIAPKASHALYRTLEIGFHCNNAHIKNEGGIIGDPTEGALKVSARKAGIAMEDAHRLSEIPFDSTTKFMAMLVRLNDDGKTYIFVKGAPEVVLSMSTQMRNADGTDSPLDKEMVLASAASFARDALRTLAFAFKKVESDRVDLTHDDMTGLSFAGLQGMIDPPKPAAIEAVAQCKKAGIRTIMVTGDHPDTARAVAQQLGIEAQQCVTGVQLSGMESETLEQLVEEVSVFARVAPEHKRDIAQALQKNGHVVAMTGDGVNDAPALKQADIGVSMGIAGTEVARESSDMVLADDNFATIVSAVEEGRHAWTNLQKAILYTLPTNAAQAFLIMGAILLAAFIPLFGTRFVLEPVQILWINLLDSVLLTLPLMMEKKEKWLLSHPPRKADAPIIDSLFIQRVVIMGFAISLPGFFIYYYFGSTAIVNGEVVNELLLTQAQTAAFWAILFAHFGYVVSARSIHNSAFSFSPFSNKWLLGGIALSIAIRFIPTLIPQAAELFRTAEFPLEWWPMILLCFFPSFIAIETDKFLRKRAA
ncbi:MAG: HAD-IC family P-type ATPase, partial [Campylobacterales bacterium]|nr:HAD-IC family P-type ATPase [Campylobacterales bacterium]